MNFNESNYYLNSTGNFKFIANIDANKSEQELTSELASLLNVDIKDIKFNYKSKLNEMGEITSIYFVYKNKLIRISDHWSTHLNNKNVAVFRDQICGKIRSCNWNLKHKVKTTKWADFEHKYFVGVIKFKDLKLNFEENRHVTWKLTKQAKQTATRLYKKVFNEQLGLYIYRQI